MVESRPTASLIISVYKNTKFLASVLNSLSFQTDKRFEVIIAEDGDSPEMKDFLSNCRLAMDYQHVCQEDLGWRKNRILNKAILAAKSDWLVFIDGDCVLHPRFVEFHLNRSHPKLILAGKRIKLDPLTSQLILDKHLPLPEINRYLWKNFLNIKKKGGRFVEEGLFIDPMGIAGIVPRLRRMHQLKGCNMSFHKEAIYAINGFDEDFVRPAIGEDIDLTWRFRNAGYRLSSLRNTAVQYHLHHPENWTDQEENIKMMRDKQSRNEFICKNGLIKQK